MRTTWIRTTLTLAALMALPFAAASAQVGLVTSAPADLVDKTEAAAPRERAAIQGTTEGTFDCSNLNDSPELSCGPDVTIISLSGTSSFGSSACPPGYNGNCRGYSVGTDSCNIGTVPVDWCDETSGCRTTTDDYHPIQPATVSDHSVIAQNLYRLKDGRFEQIGLSFLKHGFVSTNSGNTGCQWNDEGTLNSSCVSPPAGGDQLGLGCTDFYGSGLNSFRPLGRRSQTNAADADHPQNPAGGETDDDYDQRIVVAEEDLDDTLNDGALYWMEAQYVVRDDARSGRRPAPTAFDEAATGGVHPYLGTNGLNNASHRPAAVNNFSVTLTGSTVREKPAIFAWQAVDPQVEIVNVDRETLFAGDAIDPPHPPGSFYAAHWILERFHAARRVTDMGPLGGPLQYHYEIAIHNMNSDTSADGLVVDFPTAGTFANVGFHDIDHHSGEPYDTSDWTIDVDGPNGRITWSAVDAGANTNALRWGTTFSFWFDSDLPPDQIAHALDLFKIDDTLAIPFASNPNVLFEDGFESGFLPWDQVVP